MSDEVKESAKGKVIIRVFTPSIPGRTFKRRECKEPTGALISYWFETEAAHVALRDGGVLLVWWDRSEPAKTFTKPGSERSADDRRAQAEFDRWRNNPDAWLAPGAWAGVEWVR